jgi:DNA-binding transcriptional MerR regulator
MTYTVKQLADLAGVSPRTLHYYDEIGLLHRDSTGANGYRYYGREAVLALQQILFYKELDFSLDEIKAILADPDFDVAQALEQHRLALLGRMRRLERLIGTVDKTINHLKGKYAMNNQEYYEGFSEEKQKEYAREARQLWGAEAVDQSEARWASYSPERKKQIFAEGGAIFQALTERIPQGYDSPEVQEYIGRLHAYMGNFYDCTLEIFEGLGHGYNQHPDFIKFYQENYHTEMPAFLEQAISLYCQRQRG